MNLGKLPEGDMNLSTGRELGVPNGLSNLKSSVTELIGTIDELTKRLNNVLLDEDEMPDERETVVVTRMSTMAVDIASIHENVLVARTSLLKTLQRLDI